MSVEQRLERIEKKLDDSAKEQGEMKVELKGISTKMDMIVGPTGNNGTIGKFDGRITYLENKSSYLSGFFGAVGVAIGALVHWLIHRVHP